MPVAFFPLGAQIGLPLVFRFIESIDDFIYALLNMHFAYFFLSFEANLYAAGAKIADEGTIKKVTGNECSPGRPPCRQFC